MPSYRVDLPKSGIFTFITAPGRARVVTHARLLRRPTEGFPCTPRGYLRLRLATRRLLLATTGLALTLGALPALTGAMR